MKNLINSSLWIITFIHFSAVGNIKIHAYFKLNSTAIIAAFS